MQLTFLLLTTLATATAVLASPTPAPAPDDNTASHLSGWQPWDCLRNDQASAIIATFAQALRTPGNDSATYNSLVESIANVDDQELSDSINFFAGIPEGSVTTNGLANVEAGHMHEASGYFEVDTLNIWHSCNVITWRYRVTLFPGATRVQGIIVLVLGANGKIDTTYFEFNSVVWAQNLGYTVTPPAK